MHIANVLTEKIVDVGSGQIVEGYLHGGYRYGTPCLDLLFGARKTVVGGKDVQAMAWTSAVGVERVSFTILKDEVGGGGLLRDGGSGDECQPQKGKTRRTRRARKGNKMSHR